MGSGQYSEIAVMRRPPLAPTALNKLAQGRARNERRPGLLGPKKGKPCKGATNRGDLLSRPLRGLPHLRLSTQGVALGWLVKGLWPLPKNSYQTVVCLKRSTLGKIRRAH